MLSAMFCGSSYMFRTGEHAMIADLGSISHFGQVVDARQSVNIFKRVVYTVVVFSACFEDRTLRVVHVTKHNSVGRTGLLTGSLEVFIFQRTVLFFGFQFTSLSSLYAE